MMAFMVPAVSARLWIIIFSSFLIPLCLLDDMSVLARLSSVGVLCLIITMVCIAVGGVDALGDAQIDRSADRLFPTNYKEAVIALLMYMYPTAIPMVVPSLFGQMRNKDDFPKAIVRAHTIVLFIFLVITLTSFYGYYSALAEPAPSNIYLQMRSKVDNQMLVLGYVVCGTTCTSVLMSFPLVTNALFTTYEKICPETLNGNRVVHIIWRALAVSGIIITAIVGIGFFTPVIALITSVGLIPISFMFPILIYWGAQAERSLDLMWAVGRRPFTAVFHTFIFIFALLVMVQGTIISLQGFKVDPTITFTRSQGEIWGLDCPAWPANVSINPDDAWFSKWPCTLDGNSSAIVQQLRAMQNDTTQPLEFQNMLTNVVRQRWGVQVVNGWAKSSHDLLQTQLNISSADISIRFAELPTVLPAK
jgi:hypothetical protein